VNIAAKVKKSAAHEGRNRLGADIQQRHPTSNIRGKSGEKAGSIFICDTIDYLAWIKMVIYGTFPPFTT
jgi:hypothetical protein